MSHFANRPIPPKTARKFALAYLLDEETGCWNTTYSVAKRGNGYAQASWQDDGRAYGTGAHRAAWTYWNGPIPDGMTIDHMCKNRACVNPDRLRMLTNSQNARRQYGRDWPLGECINGHPDSMQETVHWAGKTRQMCRPCQDERNRVGMIKMKAKREAEKQEKAA